MATRDYLKEFKDYCLTCRYYDIKSKSDSTTRGYRCTHHHRPMSMTEQCPNYTFDYLRSNAMIDAAVEYRVKLGYSPVADKGNYYITTLVCSVLGLEDDCEYLTNFKKLKDDYMSQTPEGIAFLADYDVVGPRISEALLEKYNEPGTQIKTSGTIKVLETEYLAVVSEMVKARKMAEAMELYMQMTGMLVSYLGLTREAVVLASEVELTEEATVVDDSALARIR